MSRITSEATRLSASQEGAFLSKAQLQMDANVAGFGERATHTSTLASMTLAGLIGQSARLAFLSLGAGRVLSQLGSVGLEAAGFAGLGQLQGEERSFSESYWHSALNVAVFRAFSPFHASSLLLNQGVQATALVAAHQAAARAGLETQGTASLSEQFGQALAENVAYHVGTGLGQFLSGGAIGRIQRRVEANAALPSRSEVAALPAEEVALGMGAQGGIRRRLATAFPNRFAMGAAPLNPTQNHRETLGEIRSFADTLERVVREHTPIIENAFRMMKLTDMLRLHERLLPADPNLHPHYFRNRLKQFTDAIKHFENTQASPGDASAASRETLVNAAQGTEAAPIPAFFARFGWTRWLYLAFTSSRSAAQATQSPALPEPTPVSTEELQACRDACAQIYDNLVLTQEAVRMVRNAQGQIPESDKPRWDALESAYEELHEKLQERRQAMRRATTQFLRVDFDAFVQQWAKGFVDKIQSLRVARNFQTLLGNVFLVQGENVGGSYYGAIHQTSRKGQTFQALGTYYDAETAQLVAFVDPQSPISKKTVASLRERGRPLVKVNYVIDRDESGQIIDAIIERPVSDDCERIVRGLIGLQLFEANPFLAYTDLKTSQLTDVCACQQILESILYPIYSTTRSAAFFTASLISLKDPKLPFT